MKKLRSLILLSAISALTAGCATTTNCAGWKPIRPSPQDKLTAGTKNQILENNEFGEAQGCPAFKPN